MEANFPEDLRRAVTGAIDSLAQDLAQQRQRSLPWARIHLAEQVRHLLPGLLQDYGAEAREAGESWGSLAEALGVGTDTAARQRLHRGAAERAAAYQRPDPRREEPDLPGVSVPVAAELLGITVDAVHGRIRRGTLEGVKVDGSVRVTDRRVVAQPR